MSGIAGTGGVGGEGGVGGMSGVGGNSGQAGDAGSAGVGGGGGCPAGSIDADQDASNGCETELPLGGLGLSLWLRADLGVESLPDKKVSGWRDLSGKKFHTTYQASSSCPVPPEITTGEIGSRPTVSFGGGTCLDDLTSRSLSFTQGLTVAVVEVTRTLTPYGSFFELYSQDGLYMGRSGDSDKLIAGVTLGPDKQGLGQASTGTVTSDSVISTAPTLVLFTLDDQGKTVMRLDGKAVSTQFTLEGMTSTMPAPRPRPGEYKLSLGNNAGHTAPLDGALGEVLVFERVLSPSEIVALESLLTQRWSCCGT